MYNLRSRKNRETRQETEPVIESRKKSAKRQSSKDAQGFDESSKDAQGSTSEESSKDAQGSTSEESSNSVDEYTSVDSDGVEDSNAYSIGSFCVEDEETPTRKSIVQKYISSLFEAADKSDDSDDEYIDRVNDFMTSEYITDDWKVEVDSEKIPILEEQLNNHLFEMVKDVPTVQTILESTLTNSERKKALYLLDCLKNASYLEGDYIDRVAHLKNMINKTTLSYDEKIDALQTGDAVKGVLKGIAATITGVEDSEYRNRKTKLDQLLNLPYEKSVELSTENLDQRILQASKILDEELYKMENVKIKILSVLSNYFVHRQGIVIGLAGKPGLGKTHISKTVAKSMGLPFYNITLGCTDDVTVLLGSDSSWVGSASGEIANAYISMQSCTGVICIDEIDKSSMKIWNAINHIIDPVTNSHIRDSYLRDVEIDCSKTIFVLSLNDKTILPKYLASRIYMIDVDDLSLQDKFHITKFYKIPKISLLGEITFSDEAIKELISLSPESGYREIGNHLQHVVQILNMHCIMVSSEKASEKSSGRLPKFCVLQDFHLPFMVTKSHIQRMINVPREYNSLYV